MKTLLETTQWPGSTPNHVYFVSDSRDRMFGYVPQATGVPVRFSTPIRFGTRGRQFQAVPNTWNFTVDQAPSTRSWRVAGSRGDAYTVTEDKGVLTCSCPGFRFRGQCRHAQEKAHGLGHL